MKSFIGGLGIVFMYGTAAVYCLVGLLALNQLWGLVGIVLGVIFFPIPIMLGLISAFASWGAFIGTVIWFGLIALMINYGAEGWDE